MTGTKKKTRKDVGDCGPSRMLRVPLELYLQLQEVADKNERPAQWEGRIAIREHVRRAKGEVPA